jgi:hypothetical protein
MSDETGETENSIQSAERGCYVTEDWIWIPKPSKANISSACFFLSYIHFISPPIYANAQVGHKKPFPPFVVTMLKPLAKRPYDAGKIVNIKKLLPDTFPKRNCEIF